MPDIRQAHEALLARILEGNGRASSAQRRAAFDNAGLTEPLRTLVDKVATQAHLVGDAALAPVQFVAMTGSSSGDGACRQRDEFVGVGSTPHSAAAMREDPPGWARPRRQLHT